MARRKGWPSQREPRAWKPNRPFPLVARQAIEQHIDTCQNPGLVYERYVHYQRKGDDWALGAPTKKRVIEAAVKAQQRLASSQPLWQGFQDRWQQTIRDALTFDAHPDFRFVSGLGRGGPLEVGFTFHRIYGFPIIPGSGLKGVARAYALISLAERLEPPDLDGLDQFLTTSDKREFQQAFDQQYPDAPDEVRELVRHFRAVFGTVGMAGQAIFYDAIPLTSPLLEPDVMTPHYPDYYAEKKDSRGRPIPPADWQNPTPLPFLPVGRETLFHFAIGWRGDPNPSAHEQAKRWLENGLQELGAGAKTTAGYGYFKPRDTKLGMGSKVV